MTSYAITAEKPTEDVTYTIGGGVTNMKQQYLQAIHLLFQQ